MGGEERRGDRKLEKRNGGRWKAEREAEKESDKHSVRRLKAELHREEEGERKKEGYIKQKQKRNVKSLVLF